MMREVRAAMVIDHRPREGKEPKRTAQVVEVWRNGSDDPITAVPGYCGSCKWHDVAGLYDFHKEHADGLGDLGWCRRLPPTPYINPEQSRISSINWGEWPATGQDDWCGSWTERQRMTL